MSSRRNSSAPISYNNYYLFKSYIKFPTKKLPWKFEILNELIKLTKVNNLKYQNAVYPVSKKVIPTTKTNSRII